ncbi:BPTI/Kunitz inhibitor domain-containing protein [Caenorhabditis elegans]|uniref:BPTI/Kunitz inhibitor domain-containing protein n=1 Tax=Caenorhabditis elegans TaxID=6239 RepID=C0Z3L5_CAEEL|nr:BPTI/Kunitz inhibitor domain-containing protein [Caenorhabditis elegans]CAX65088.2 BPTI/Kunitz inhibitor domain-containing protein [Caenorhabditis elegans]|eukprot:NP_001256874.1 Uncharacterized protein CELE_Y43F8B.3 [Caenorhabditis elegans]
MPPLRWLFLVLCAVVAVRAADDSLIGSFKTMFFGNEPEKTNDSATSSQNNPPISYHQYATASSPSSRSQPPSGQSCTLPRQIGTGPYRIPRWYYNPVRGRCELFYWSGCCGNGNNFQTFQTCQSTCEVDPCSQDKEPGVGAVQLPRFFFNKDSRICEQFQYFGTGGNRNNFQTLEECQAQCPESPNPCAVTGGATLSPCAPGQGCGTGSYCHVGAQTQTTVCCPKPAAVDRCQQPLNVGIGNSNLQRWYFNPLTQQCSTCTYRGLQGNENNFLSQNECEQSCLVNPCKIGSPYRSQGITVQCSAMSPTVCPAGHYCHLGADATTSVCCQALGNSPCEEEMTQGEGPSALTRFYYDASQRKCLAFNYLGLKGNRNNFQSKEHCESTCPVWTNPCAIGQPIMTVGQKPFQCHQGATCSTGYFCHLGYDDATTVCCQSEGDPCSLVVKEGSGNHHLSRWFYNSNTRQCQPFTYTGQGGNENNFLLREHCEATCPVWINACPSGEPYLLPNGKPQPCDSANVNSCPLTHWCHPGPDASTTMCCPGKADPCTQTLAQGEGPLSVARFYFNAQSRTCDEFMFRGLKGNSNNFKSQEDCEKACPVQQNPCPITMSSLKHSAKLVPCSATKSCPSQQWCHYGETKETTVCCPNAVDDPCTAPPRNPGVGEFHATRWAFDGSARKCVPFEYRGMKGNSNNFLTRENCEKRCPVFQNPCKIGEPHIQNNQYMQCSPQQVCPGGHYCHVGTEANYCCKALGGDPCGQPLDRGVGGSQLSRWYWNQQSQCCLPFSYCGQKGTQNNFLTKQDCDRTCYELDNPCALGDPQMAQNNRPLQCSATASTCGAQFWCHFGANQDTTVCCPGRVESPQICQQPMAVGTGGATLPRWYYNAQTMQCVQFNYAGRMGNQNNFQSQQACEQTCPVYVNVCPTGSPMLDASTNKPVPCTFGSNSCGADHWCHLGLVPDEYQCCPGSPTNPGACQGLPESEGVTGAPAPPTSRWYYDQTDMQCKQFTYNGRRGNQNNFLTQEDCAATCDVFTNPCNQPIALPATLCSGTGSSDTCGANMWCHIGANQDSTVCCPSEGDPCSLPLARGSGNQFMDRFYYNQQTGSCQQFTYSGLHGNQNNFLTQQACEEQCGPNPCFEGRPFVGADGRTQTCSASANFNTCPLNHWCHIGSDLSTTVCCPGASTNACNLPMSTGEGNARLDRFYYDQQTKTCRPFVYNGLKGNQNNFISLRACQLSCQPLDNPCIGQPATTAAGQVLFCSITNKDSCPVNFWCHIGATPETTVCCPGATNPCSVPLAPGTGNAGLARYYYNPDDRQCLPFQYNGKRGNQNNFENQADCERTCPVFINPCLGEVILEDGAPKPCKPLLKNSCGSATEFCHTGNPSDQNSSFCCPRINQDPCNAFVRNGEGNFNMTRYYYNPVEGDCFSFQYRGLKGNENNFLTLKMCQETCKPLTTACFGGESPLMNNGRVVQCHNHVCPTSHYCHRGADVRSTVCCARRGNSCDQQLMLGVGDAAIDRYYYDTTDDACMAFNYTGVGGNENNFLTKAECQIACPGYRGYCPHGKPDVTDHSLTTCGIDTGCPRDHVCHVSKRGSKTVCCPDPASFCLVRADPGPCNREIPRWAYDKASGSCKKFIFGGCQGNLNNFDTVQKCTEICCDKGYN